MLPVQNFVDEQGPVISADWLNAMDQMVLHYDPAEVWDQGTGAFLNGIYGQTAEELAAGITPTNYSCLPGDFRRYGAVGDGVANDRDAIRTAIALQKASGIAIFGHEEDTYYLGTFPNTTGETKFTIDYDHARIYPRNCKFTATANLDASMGSSYKQIIFLLQNANDWYIGDAHVEADAVNQPPNQQRGVAAVIVYNTSAATRLGRLGSIKGKRLMATFAANTDDATNWRHEILKADLLSNQDGYYTTNFVNNVDGFVATIHSRNNVRSYFPYGITGHDVVIVSELHAFFNDILISRTTRDTSGIRIKYDCLSSTTSTPDIALQHENSTDDGVISNVEIQLNVVKSNTANPTIRFQCFDGSGVERTTTNSRFDNIRIRGTTNSVTPIELGPTLTCAVGQPGNLSRLYIEESLLYNLVDYKSFIVQDGTTRQLAIGSSANSMSCVFNVSAFRLYPTWARLTIWGADDGTGTGTNYFVRESWLYFTVSSAGVVVISANSTITTFSADPGGFAPALVLSGSAAQGYSVTAQITGYTGGSRYCRGWLDILGIQP